MENNLNAIVAKIKELVLDFSLTLSGEELEMTVIHEIIEELLTELNITDKRDDMFKALMNMYILGTILPAVELKNNEKI